MNRPVSLTWTSSAHFQMSIWFFFFKSTLSFLLCFAKVKMLCPRRSSVLSQQVQNKFKHARKQKGRSSISKDDAVQRVNQCWKKMRSSISKDEAVRRATQCWKKTKERRSSISTDDVVRRAKQCWKKIKWKGEVQSKDDVVWCANQCKNTHKNVVLVF